MKEKKKFNPIWFLVFGICFLIIPSAIYLGFLIPQMKDEYIILMASGGCIGSGGIAAAQFIPETAKFGTLYKTASKSFSLLVVITLVQDFIPQLIGFAATLVVSYIIFIIFKELWKNGKRKAEHADLAKEITRGIAETIK